MKKVLPEKPKAGEHIRIHVGDNIIHTTTIEVNEEPLTLDVPNSWLELYYNGEEWVIV